MKLPSTFPCPVCGEELGLTMVDPCRGALRPEALEHIRTHEGDDQPRCPHSPGSFAINCLDCWDAAAEAVENERE